MCGKNVNVLLQNSVKSTFLNKANTMYVIDVFWGQPIKLQPSFL